MQYLLEWVIRQVVILQQDYIYRQELEGLVLVFRFLPVYLVGTREQPKRLTFRRFNSKQGNKALTLSREILVMKLEIVNDTSKLFDLLFHLMDRKGFHKQVQP